MAHSGGRCFQMKTAASQPAIVRRLIPSLTPRMKKTDLEKNKAQKIMGQMRQSGVPGRFAEGSAQVPDRREQRKLDQALGLVPFAVKLHGDLVKQLQDTAEREGVTLNELADRVIRAGLASSS